MECFVEKVIPMYMGKVGFKYNKQFMNIFAYLIFTKDGIYLLDTGLNRLFIEENNKIYQDLSMFMIVKVNKDELLEEKIEKFGLSLERIKGVICSHLHFDHAGGLNCFSRMNTPIWIAHSELEDAKKTKRSFEYKREDFDFLDKYENIVYINDATFVDGNSNICIVPTPGHSAGHLSLLLSGKSKKMLLTGDAVYTMTGLMENKINTFAFSRSAAINSLNIIHSLKVQCDYVICGHDCDEYSDCEISLQ